jgi:antitoxin component of MazEF toxin-antitoxin module
MMQEEKASHIRFGNDGELLTRVKRARDVQDRARDVQDEKYSGEEEEKEEKASHIRFGNDGELLTSLKRAWDVHDDQDAGEEEEKEEKDEDYVGDYVEAERDMSSRHPRCSGHCTAPHPPCMEEGK